MSKQTSMNRLKKFKINSNRTAFWLKKMDNILDAERAKGLIGFHLSVDPTAAKGDIARDFCLMYPIIQWDVIQVSPEDIEYDIEG